MDKAMIASGMTKGQIQNLADKFCAAANKHAGEIPSETAQIILGMKNIGMELFALIRKYAESIRQMIIRRVEVDGKLVDVYFFRPRPENVKGDSISIKDLEKEYEYLDLKSADLNLIRMVNIADPNFRSQYPNATLCKDDSGEQCLTVFYRCIDGTDYINTINIRHGVLNYWWLAGVRK